MGPLYHVGSLYTIALNLDAYVGWNPTSYTKQDHSIDNIVKYFTQTEASSFYLSDWPVVDWSETINFMSTNQKDVYFKYAKWDRSSYRYNMPISVSDDSAKFNITYNAHYQVEEYDSKLTMPLQHFAREMQYFLLKFYKHMQGVDKARRQQELVELGIPDKIVFYLVNFRIIEASDHSLIVTLEDSVLRDMQGFAKFLPATPIHQFRAELSTYLQDNPKMVRELLLMFRVIS